MSHEVVQNEKRTCRFGSLVGVEGRTFSFESSSILITSSSIFVSALPGMGGGFSSAPGQASNCPSGDHSRRRTKPGKLSSHHNRTGFSYVGGFIALENDKHQDVSDKQVTYCTLCFCFHSEVFDFLLFLNSR